MTISLSMPTLPKRSDNTVGRSQAERLWLVGGGLVALVLFVIGYFFFISPQRSKTSDVNGQVSTAQQQNSVLQQHIDALSSQNKNLAKYEAELKAARLALPAGNGVSDFVRSLQSLGNATQTSVTNVTVGAGTAVAATPAPGASAAPSATAASTGLVSYAISVQVSGSPAALDRFLEQLQAVQPRAVLINQLTESSGTGAGSAAGAAAGGTSLQLSMQAFATSAAATPSH